MNLLFITPANLDRTDAPSVRIRRFARYWRKKGHCITVIGHGSWRGDPDKDFTAITVPFGEVRFLGTILFHMLVPPVLLYLFARQSWDGVILREMPFFPYAGFFARVTGTPLLVRVNAANLEEARRDGRGTLWLTVARFWFRWNYRCANRVIVLTESLKQYLTETYGVPNERIRVIGNAVDTNLFQPLSKESCRENLDLNPDEIHLFYVGSFHPQHGMSHLVKILAKLFQKRNDVRAIFAGEGKERSTILDMVQSRSLDDRIRLPGRVSDQQLVRYIGASDYCVNPVSPAYRHTTERTFPQKVYEYLACGRPVISLANSDPLQDVLVKRGGGFIVKNPEQPEQAAEEINQMITREKKFVPEELRSIAEDRSYPRVVETYETLLRTLNE